MKLARGFLVGLSVLWSACDGDQRQAGGSQQAQQPGMPGMAMKMPSLDMLPAVRAYLDSVAAAEPRELASLAAGHAARVEPMLAAMDQDMKAMNMTGDAGWQALADSARADLTAMPRVRGEQLVLHMRAHAGRMRRLLEMHERMMGRMRM